MNTRVGRRSSSRSGPDFFLIRADSPTPLSYAPVDANPPIREQFEGSVVANFIREGKIIKEIARICGVSENAIE